MDNIQLKGDSVQLIPYNPIYWPTLAKWCYSDNCKEFFRHYPKVLTEDECKNYDKLINGEVFLIHSLEDGSVIGLIQIYVCDKRNRGGYIGIILEESHQKQRLTNEVMVVFLEYIFNRQGYNKVILEILESNTCIRKALDKTGWYKEGKLIQECFLDGKYQNELRYSMSAYYFNKNKDKVLKEYRQWQASLKK